MMNWREYLKKAGGIGLIRQYLRTGTLFTAVNQFTVIGRDRKALEILRLAVEHRLNVRLRKKYNRNAAQLKESIDSSYHKESAPVKKVWLCWWQGMDNAPDLVKKCYQSIKAHLTDWEIVIVTRDNYFQYVSFPEYIIRKWEIGIISNTHMSDL
ncbi:capsular polysaccharide synthesis protein, partial [Bacteroides acidifaciens]|uniref:capsular polysaccharide synthesis protein n=3 Tax=Bacteroidales TaxID=171549 RepID=UPI0025B452B5